MVSRERNLMFGTFVYVSKGITPCGQIFFRCFEPERRSLSPVLVEFRESVCLGYATRHLLAFCGISANIRIFRDDKM